MIGQDSPVSDSPVSDGLAAEEVVISSAEGSAESLLEIGKPEVGEPDAMLRLGEEAALLKKILEQGSDLSMRPTARRKVDVLLQPSAAEVSRTLERGDYNVFFLLGAWGAGAGWGSVVSVGCDDERHGACSGIDPRQNKASCI